MTFSTSGPASSDEGFLICDLVKSSRGVVVITLLIIPPKY